LLSLQGITLWMSAAVILGEQDEFLALLVAARSF
jgi:hypothetical protein